MNELNVVKTEGCKIILAKTRIATIKNVLRHTKKKHILHICNVQK